MASMCTIPFGVVLFCVLQSKLLQNHQHHHVQLTKFMTLVEQPVRKRVTAHHLLVHSSVFLAVGVQVALLDMKVLVLKELLVQVRLTKISSLENL